MNTIRQHDRWRKARASSDSSSCVEVRFDLAALQDSKRPGPILEPGKAALTVFRDWVKTV